MTSDMQDEGMLGQASDVDRLVYALQRVRDQPGKSNVRSTDHVVRIDDGASSTTSAVVQEVEGDGDEGSTTHASTSAQTVLTSWRTQEFAYRKVTKVGLRDEDELPTLARGLFTTETKSGHHRIVVRGYDKFFNVGELPWTKEEAIAVHSRSPYELSFKENGCIIFIAALTPTRLIVTSKHSLGGHDSLKVSHAQKGEEWLERHLASKGRSKAALAAELWRSNETAVAELCDDSFEEHVLAYPADRTGLHLHGLNANTVEFQTRSMTEVAAFAQAWGFHSTRFILLDSLTDVEHFCRSVAETGNWQGIPIEGFVVRTRTPQSDEIAYANKTVAPPYRPGQTWFYKVKFDEPYLMYRDWRELTRRMLSEKEKYEKARQQEEPNLLPSTMLSEANEQKSKSAKKREQKRAEQERRAAEAAAGLRVPDPPQPRSGRPETRLFVEWCHEKMYGSTDGSKKVDAQAFEGFSQNKGIIRLRDRFIEYMQCEEGKARLSKFTRSAASVNVQGEAITSVDETGKPFTKCLVVPIAIPGCGKTVVANALAQLIPDFGHTQSDDVQAKKTAATFVRNILSELNNHRVVFADRNNHLFKHRNEIVDAVRDWQAKDANHAHRVRIVALAWKLDELPLNALHHICSERIVRRGENHQSLRSSANKEHEKILWNFLRQLQPFGSAERGTGDQGHGDEAFDAVIALRVNASMQDTLATTYAQLASMLDLPSANKEQLEKSLQRALEYKVSIRKEVKGAPLPSIRYYGLAVQEDVVQTLLPLLSAHQDALHAVRTLLQLNRIILKPHITLVHSSDLATSLSSSSGSSSSSKDDEKRARTQRRWDTYAALARADPAPVFSLSIDVLAWDEKAMALGAYDVQSPDVAHFDTLQDVEWRPHVTLGTFSENVRPFEANRVLCDADARRENVHTVRFTHPIRLTARLRGLW